MALDGEWRVAFIQAEHPELEYATAPLPVDDGHDRPLRSGEHQRDDHRHAQDGKHQEEAWELRQVPDDADHALAELSNGLRNVPTTKASLTSKEIKPDAHFATFLKIFANPQTTTIADHADREPFGHLNNYIDKWQAGRGGDLAKACRRWTRDTNAQLGQGGGIP